MSLRSAAKSFLCYVNQRAGGVPYFQVLPECSWFGAVVHAARLLREHDDCETADLWVGEQLWLSVSRSDLALINIDAR